MSPTTVENELSSRPPPVYELRERDDAERGSLNNRTALRSVVAAAEEDSSAAATDATNATISTNDNDHPPAETVAFPTMPDGGYGWVVVVSSAVFTFWFNGIGQSWGVMQTALLKSGFATTSTVSFVGTLSNTCIVALGLLAVRFMRVFGARATGLVGVALMGLGELASSFLTTDVGGLFATAGVLLGSGASLLYMSANTVPVQYFDARLGLANGIVKGAGGLGGTVLALTLDALINRLGTSWTFRILGLLVFATGMPAAWFLKERKPTPTQRAPFVDFSVFRNLSFVAVFVGGAIGTFALFVPPFFLPLFAESLGLSSSTGAGLVAGFNVCTMVGRVGGGISCDRLGPINTLLGAMLLNAVSMLAIWPVSSAVGPLVVFATLNGIANGAFFTTFPTVVTSMFGPQRAAVAMGMATTGWTAGYLMGAPIAGYLLQSQGGEKTLSIGPYRPAIFYAGGVACASSAFVLLARVRSDRKIIKRV